MMQIIIISMAGHVTAMSEHDRQIHSARRSVSRWSITNADTWTTAIQFWLAWQEHYWLQCTQYLTLQLGWRSQPRDRNT